MSKDDNQNDQPGDQDAEAQHRIEELETQLAESQDQVKKLEDQHAEAQHRIEELEGQLADKSGTKAPALKMSQADLGKALEKELGKSKDKISKLLIRAKNVKNKGLKIETNIVMKSGGDTAKKAITETLESLIRESGDAFKQLLATVTPAKDKVARVRVTIV